MTIAYNIAYSLLDDPTLRDRVRYAILHSAAYVLIEDPATPDHADRIDWARKAFAEALQMPIRQVMVYVITDATVAQVGAAATDAQLQAAIDAAIPYLVLGG